MGATDVSLSGWMLFVLGFVVIYAGLWDVESQWREGRWPVRGLIVAAVGATIAGWGMVP